MGALHRLATNPRINLVVAVLLLVASGWEVFETFDEPSLGTHHGVLVFALMQVIKALPDIIDGAKTIDDEVHAEA